MKIREDTFETLEYDVFLVAESERVGAMTAGGARAKLRLRHGQGGGST
jgi:hypothetical protein